MAKGEAVKKRLSFAIVRFRSQKLTETGIVRAKGQSFRQAAASYPWRLGRVKFGDRNA